MRLEMYVAEKEREAERRTMERSARLADALSASGRIGELAAALRDPDAWQRLMDEFGIDTKEPSATGLPMVDD